MIFLTSTISGEGKTFIAINFAISLAMIDKKVLLIGADIRKPKFSTYLNQKPKKGLTHYLVDKSLNVSDVIEFHKESNIDVIFAGEIPPNPSELLLNGRFENILDYAIRKPWNKVFNFTADMLFSMITEKGIIDKSFIIEIFDILFKTADISNKTTMLEFYNKSKIKLHFYTTNVKLFETVELSHTSHPELSVIDAVYMSCSIPFIFQPIYTK